jgi:hypothetical protein
MIIFLCTGGMSYAPFILMLISNLFSTKGEGVEGRKESPPPLPPQPGRSEFTLSLWGRGRGGGARGGPLEGVGPENNIKTHNIQNRIQNTEYRHLQQNSCT